MPLKLKLAGVGNPMEDSEASAGLIIMKGESSAAIKRITRSMHDGLPPHMAGPETCERPESKIHSGTRTIEKQINPIAPCPGTDETMCPDSCNTSHDARTTFAGMQSRIASKPPAMVAFVRAHIHEINQ